MTTPKLTGGPLASALCTLVVRAMAENAGHGPTRARATLDEDLFVVAVHGSLTTFERRLVDAGDEALVLEMRQHWQSVMRSDLVAGVEELSGRKVAAFMSANHLDPDVGVEIFTLVPVGAAD